MNKTNNTDERQNGNSNNLINKNLLPTKKQMINKSKKSIPLLDLSNYFKIKKSQELNNIVSKNIYEEKNKTIDKRTNKNNYFNENEDKASVKEKNFENLNYTNNDGIFLYKYIFI